MAALTAGGLALAAPAAWGVSGAPLPTTTTTTAAPRIGPPAPHVPTSTTTTTTTAPPAGGGAPSGGGAGSGGGGTGSTGSAGGGPQSSGGGSTPPSDPALQAQAASVPRSGSASTAGLLEALAPLAHYGLSPVQIAVVGFGQFPVAGASSYSDDWLEYRAFPQPHLHQGVDIVADYGTPLRAPAAGVLTYSNSDPDGYGLTALVTAADGTVFVLAHMSATVLGLSSGTAVKQGQVIGFVGSSGDATGPHCHFEIHPGGGRGVDPKPILDQWVAAATAAAPGLVDAFARAAAGPTTTVPPVPASVPQATIPPAATRPLALAAPAGSLSGGAGWSSRGLLRALALVGVLGAGALVIEAVSRRLRLP